MLYCNTSLVRTSWDALWENVETIVFIMFYKGSRFSFSSGETEKLGEAGDLCFCKVFIRFHFSFSFGCRSFILGETEIIRFYLVLAGFISVSPRGETENQCFA